MKKVVVVKKQNGLKKVQDKSLAQTKRQKTFISKCVDIIIKDIKDMIFRTRIVVEDEPAGFEEYKRFCELARGERK